ncbi:MAG: chemotaxis protein CheA [Sporolactobacillus sp.]
MDMDMSQYLGVFVDEAREHLQNLSDKLMELEEKSDDPELINSIFRSAHTLKGSSGQMGFANMMELTHTMENVFDALRHHKVNVTSEMVDCLFETVDILSGVIDRIAEGGDDAADVAEITAKLQNLLTDQDASKTDNRTDQVSSAGAAPSVSKDDAVKMSFDDYELDTIEQALSNQMNVFETVIALRQDCVLKAARALMVSNAIEDLGTILKSEPSTEDIEKEAFDHSFAFLIVTQEDADAVQKNIMAISEIESVSVHPVKMQAAVNQQKQAPVDERAEKQTGKSSKASSGAENKKVAASKTIRVNLERLDNLLNLFEELIIDRSRIEKISHSLGNKPLNESIDQLKRISNQLQETILNLRMEPVEQVFNRFPRMIRSLAKELNKKVNLVITGEETELDRTVIDELGDPLMHMIRNSMDHGIEHPEDRQKIGKPEEGMLALRAYHSGHHVFIEIEDDGAGINKEKVLSKAIEKGIIAEGQADQMTDKEINHLLFESGFSTADKISDISGRGVGLDVVESKIHSLSGSVEVDSTPGKGTRFTVKLPLTLSIINALMVQCGSEIYAIPITSIYETALRRQTTVQLVQNMEVARLREHVIPIVHLEQFLSIPSCAANEESDSVVYVKSGDRIIGIVVEKLLGYQDIVIKPLNNYLKKVRGFSGATILGDGTVALILDCQDMIQSQKKQLLKQSV